MSAVAPLRRANLSLQDLDGVSQLSLSDFRAACGCSDSAPAASSSPQPPLPQQPPALQRGGRAQEAPAREGTRGRLRAAPDEALLAAERRRVGGRSVQAAWFHESARHGRWDPWVRARGAAHRHSNIAARTRVPSSVTVQLCTSLNIDPALLAPEAASRSAAPLYMWQSPLSMPSAEESRLLRLSQALEEQYKTLATRPLRTRHCPNPRPSDITQALGDARKEAGGESKVVFHYLAHGLQPLRRGNLCVLNPSTQVDLLGAPSPVIDVPLDNIILRAGFPLVLVADCHNAGGLLRAFLSKRAELQEQQEKFSSREYQLKSNQKRSSTKLDELGNTTGGGAGGGSGGGGAASGAIGGDDNGDAGRGGRDNWGTEASCIVSAAGTYGWRPERDYTDFFFIGAAGADGANGGAIASHPLLPDDVLTCCLTTPLRTAMLWFVVDRSQFRDLHPVLLRLTPGTVADKKTTLGQLQWYLLTIAECIAWSTLPLPLYSRLFREDVYLKPLFTGYLLAERLLVGKLGGAVSVYPPMPPTHAHPLWTVWDNVLERSCVSLLQAVAPAPPPVLTVLEFRQWLDARAVEWWYQNRSEGLPVVTDPSRAVAPNFFNEELRGIEATLEGITTQAFVLPQLFGLADGANQPKDPRTGAGDSGTGSPKATPGAPPAAGRLRLLGRVAYTNTSLQLIDDDTASAGTGGAAGAGATVGPPDILNFLERRPRQRTRSLPSATRLGSGSTNAGNLLRPPPRQASQYRSQGSAVAATASVVQPPSAAPEEYRVKRFTEAAEAHADGAAGAARLPLLDRLPVVLQGLLAAAHRGKATALACRIADVGVPGVMQCAEGNLFRAVLDQYWLRPNLRPLLPSALFMYAKSCYVDPQLVNVDKLRTQLAHVCGEVLAEPVDVPLPTAADHGEPATVAAAAAAAAGPPGAWQHATLGPYAGEDGQRVLAASLLALMCLHIPDVWATCSKQNVVFPLCCQLICLCGEAVAEEEEEGGIDAEEEEEAETDTENDRCAVLLPLSLLALFSTLLHRWSPPAAAAPAAGNGEADKDEDDAAPNEELVALFSFALKGLEGLRRSRAPVLRAASCRALAHVLGTETVPLTIREEYAKAIERRLSGAPSEGNTDVRLELVGAASVLCRWLLAQLTPHATLQEMSEYAAYWNCRWYLQPGTGEPAPSLERSAATVAEEDEAAAAAPSGGNDSGQNIVANTSFCAGAARQRLHHPTSRAGHATAAAAASLRSPRARAVGASLLVSGSLWPPPGPAADGGGGGGDLQRRRVRLLLPSLCGLIRRLVLFSTDSCPFVASHGRRVMQEEVLPQLRPQRFEARQTRGGGGGGGTASTREPDTQAFHTTRTFEQLREHLGTAEAFAYPPAEEHQALYRAFFASMLRGGVSVGVFPLGGDGDGGDGSGDYVTAADVLQQRSMDAEGAGIGGAAGAALSNASFSGATQLGKVRSAVDLSSPMSREPRPQNWSFAGPAAADRLATSAATATNNSAVQRDRSQSHQRRRGGGGGRGLDDDEDGGQGGGGSGETALRVLPADDDVALAAYVHALLGFLAELQLVPPDDRDPRCVFNVARSVDADTHLQAVAASLAATKYSQRVAGAAAGGVPPDAGNNNDEHDEEDEDGKGAKGMQLLGACGPCDAVGALFHPSRQQLLTWSAHNAVQCWEYARAGQRRGRGDSGGGNLLLQLRQTTGAGYTLPQLLRRAAVPWGNTLEPRCRYSLSPSTEPPSSVRLPRRSAAAAASSPLSSAACGPRPIPRHQQIAATHLVDPACRQPLVCHVLRNGDVALVGHDALDGAPQLAACFATSAEPWVMASAARSGGGCAASCYQPLSGALSVGTARGAVSTWDLCGERCAGVVRLSDGDATLPPSALAAHPDAPWVVAAAAADRPVLLCDTRSGRRAGEFASGGAGGLFFCERYCSALLCLGSAGATLWDCRHDREPLWHLPADSAPFGTAGYPATRVQGSSERLLFAAVTNGGWRTGLLLPPAGAPASSVTHSGWREMPGGAPPDALELHPYLPLAAARLGERLTLFGRLHCCGVL